MSGIAGIVRLDGAPVSGAQIGAIVAELQTRGPDRSGAWYNGHSALGHTLLATTPEARAETQPWRHAGSGCVVVSDSRLDNRIELLHTLGLPATEPDAVGDAELLYAAYERWGSDCADHLLGDFAFAIWDARQQTLFCARDVMGVRPFYYHHAPGRLFAFASEPQALLTLADIPPTLNEGRIADALVSPLEGIDTTSTFYSAVQRLPPAHTARVRANAIEIREYWTPIGAAPFSSDVADEMWLEGLRDHLTNAVRCRLRASVQVGSMLSGGLDSSSVVALASRQLGADGRAPLVTFSGVSSLPNCLETRAIRRMVAHSNISSTELDWQNLQGLLESVAERWPTEPFDALMTIIDCLYVLAAGHDVRVVLDGIDADTLFFEGPYLEQLATRGKWRTMAREARGMARFYGQGVTPWNMLRPVISKTAVPVPVRRFVRACRASSARRRLYRDSQLDSVFADRVDVQGRLQTLSTALERAPASAGGAHTSMRSTYTTAGIERYGRVAANRAIEPRHPFLDRRLIEYCAWLPLGLRLRDGWPKWALRKAMSGILPDDVAWRAGKPDLGWRFNHALMNHLGQTRTRPAPADSPLIGYVDPHRQRGEDTSARGDQWESTLTLASLEAWLSRPLTRHPFGGSVDDRPRRSNRIPAADAGRSAPSAVPHTPAQAIWGPG